jgi:hypothetical protein
MSGCVEHSSEHRRRKYGIHVSENLKCHVDLTRRLMLSLKLCLCLHGFARSYYKLCRDTGSMRFTGLAQALIHEPRPDNTDNRVRSCFTLHQSDLAKDISGFLELFFFAKKNVFLVHSVLMTENELVQGPVTPLVRCELTSELRLSRTYT